MKSKHRLNRMELREERAAYGFLFISLIGTVTFILVPIIMSMFLGFTAWNPMKGLAGVEFTGLENFQNILKDDRVLSLSLIHILSCICAYGKSQGIFNGTEI